MKVIDGDSFYSFRTEVPMYNLHNTMYLDTQLQNLCILYVCI